MVLGLGRVELSSVKAMKVTRPTLAADGAKAAFQDQSDRSRCSTAIRLTDLLVRDRGTSRRMQREGVNGVEGDGEGGRE